VEWSSAADGKRRMVTMLFQRDTLLPWKSVQGNIDFALQFAGISKQEAADRADRLLELAGLTAFRGTRPAHLSGGMRRRAGLVVAIAPWPELVVMDEPFSSVDEPTRVEIHKSILDIARDSGISLLIVTHDVAEAVTLASRVYVLSRRPSACVAEYDVPFGQDRDVYKLRETPQYHELYSTIWHRLREEIQKPRQPEGEEA
jgi:NitT/TauT family transport system ATP-binding protein